MTESQKHSDQVTGGQESPGVDPVTGYHLTDHDWGGIRELNTPMSRIAVWALIITFAYSVIAWVLLPAWPSPTGTSYTKGLLGLDQGEVAWAGFQKIDTRRSEWFSAFDDPDFETLAADPDLMARAMPAAARLFTDNCAVCHGEDAKGGPGYPSLVAADWLWEGDPEGIAETIRVGINSTHDETRFGQMPAFGADGMLPRADLEAVTDYVVAIHSGEVDDSHPGALVFEENCAACHGDRGTGGLGIGAPSLVDEEVIYGQDRNTVWRTVWGGREGVMPHWEGRLRPAEINLLALYLSELASEGAAPTELAADSGEE